MLLCAALIFRTGLVFAALTVFGLIGHRGSWAIFGLRGDMSRADGSNEKNARTISDSHRNQIQVLKILSKEGITEAKQYEIAEIAELTGLRDEKEVQRYLLILEGQKLVAPFPEGDFTSNRWRITKEGIRAMRSIPKSLLQ